VSSVTISPGQYPDDAAAINAALADPDILEVVLGAGLFQLHSPIFVPSGKTLRGAGRDDTILRAEPDFSRAAGEYDGVVNSLKTALEPSSTGIQLYDVAVDANKLSPGGYRMVGVFMHQSTDFVIERVDVSNATAYAHFVQGDLGAAGVTASGRYSDIRTYNSQVHFEQMNANGVLIENAHAFVGEGDIPTEAFFHPLFGSKNITYLDVSGYGPAYGGFSLVSSGVYGAGAGELAGQDNPLENITIINADIEITGPSSAITALGYLPVNGLNIVGSRFVSHGQIAAQLGGVTGTATDSYFEGNRLGAIFWYSGNGTATDFVATDTDAIGIQSPTSAAAAFGISSAGGHVEWIGGTIEARAELMIPLGSPNIIVSPETQLISTGFDATLNFLENTNPAPIAPSLEFDGGGLGPLGGGSLTVSLRGFDMADDLGILDGGDQRISLQADDVLYDGSLIGNVRAATGETLIVDFTGEASVEAVEALIRAISFTTSLDSSISLLRAVAFTVRDAVGATADLNGVVTIEPNLSPEAQDDHVGTSEDMILSGHLFADNGAGPDLDPDGNEPLLVAEVEGSEANVGTPFLLASGARLTVHSDGSYIYDPNGAFDALTEGAGGAANLSAIDTFSYRLVGGSLANVGVSVVGVTGPGDVLSGGAADDLISGTLGSDLFGLQQGGEDQINGNDGNDLFYFGDAFTGGDTVDGGNGADAVVLQGDYILTLSATNIFNVESISLQSGSRTTWGDTANNFYDYSITTVDANVAAGQQLIVNGQSLRAGADFVFDGSAETDGKFLVFGGNGVDTLKGGAGNDIFVFADARWGAGDSVDGGSGRDALVISAGNGTTHIEFGATGLINVESVSVSSVYVSVPGAIPSYEFVLHDGNTAAGQTLIVNGSSLLNSSQTISVDGSAELDGQLILFGGAGADTLIGSAQADLVNGGDNADMLTGGGGADIFRYDSVAHSTAAARDHILDFMSGTDKVDLSRIDADAIGTGDQAFNFIGDAAFSNVAGQLRFENISLGGPIWLVQGDTDGDGVSDFEVLLVLSTPDPITAGDFIL
jgi:Ca2+-binding RTX toxin-like protein